MNKSILHYLFLLFSIGFLSLNTSCLSNVSSDIVETSIIQVGDIVPSFSVDNGRGTTFTSEAFKGKRSLLVFYHSECPDCSRELPRVEEVWKILQAEEDCQVIAISRQETLAATESFWVNKGLTYPVFLDPDRSVYALFATRTIPRLYAINSQGVVTWMGIEDIHESVEELAGIIRNQK